MAGDLEPLAPTDGTGRVSRRVVLGGVAGALALPAVARGAAAEPIRIGVLDDMSSDSSDMTGVGEVLAARMAIEDNGGSVLGRPVELVSGDHQQKADVAGTLARKWFDTMGVDMITGLGTSSTAFLVQTLAEEKHRLVFSSAASAPGLHEQQCSRFAAQFAIPVPTLVKSVVSAPTHAGADTWFLIVTDYVFGHQLEEYTRKYVAESGGRVVGVARHPLGTADFSALLVQAQASGAKMVAFANGAGDLVRSVTQANEFGLAANGTLMCCFILQTIDVKAIGLQSAQGLLSVNQFYWDRDDASRAWTKRFMAQHDKPPSDQQVACYSAVNHYLKSVAAAGTTEADTVMAKARSLPVRDFYNADNVLGPDGLVRRPCLLTRVKKPAESVSDWDLQTVEAVLPSTSIYDPPSHAMCPIVPG